MADTPRLALPLLAAAQAQKHVTHNEALLALDALVQLAVIDRDLAEPPASPAEGDRYIVAAPGAGPWAGRGNAVAVREDGAWRYYGPGPGWTAFVEDEATLLAFQDGAWRPATPRTLGDLLGLGLGTGIDPGNPFSAKLNAALWTARGAGEGGTGDLRMSLNKEAAGRVLSLVWQTDYGARAECGLLGDDDFSLKVSPDGATFREAMRVGRASGAAHFPHGVAHGSGSGGRLTLQSFNPIPTGDVTDASTLHFTPYEGDQTPVFDGSAFVWRRFSELTLTLTAQHLAATLYDVYVFDDAGTLRLGTGPAWASAVQRGSGAGTGELERRAGVLVNRFPLTLRAGADLRSVEANRATYLGTVRTTVAGRTEDVGGGGGVAARRYLWNAYNRRPRPMRTGETLASWAYATAAWRRMNGNANLELRFVVGVAEDEVQASGAMSCAGPGSAGIGLNWTSGGPDARGVWGQAAGTGGVGTAAPSLRFLCPPGHHALAPLELGGTGATFYGAPAGGGASCGITATIQA